MRFTCSICGRITEERRCPDHAPRDRSKQRRFRALVLLRDAHRCRRCGSQEDLRAAHWPIPLRAMTEEDDPYDPRHGITLCGPCDRKFDPHAR